MLQSVGSFLCVQAACAVSHDSMSPGRGDVTVMDVGFTIGDEVLVGGCPELLVDPLSSASHVLHGSQGDGLPEVCLGGPSLSCSGGGEPVGPV